MNNQKAIIGAISMDLKRIVLASQRGSTKVAQKFADQANIKLSLIVKSREKPYITRLLNQLPSILINLTDKQSTENLLMYSTLLQNHATQ